MLAVREDLHAPAVAAVGLADLLDVARGFAGRGEDLDDRLLSLLDGQRQGAWPEVRRRAFEANEAVLGADFVFALQRATRLDGG